MDRVGSLCLTSWLAIGLTGSPNLFSSHPDELLKARLTFLDPSKSLIEEDLQSLTQGLEGRTTNPVSLLVSFLNDSLMKAN